VSGGQENESPATPVRGEKYARALDEKDYDRKEKETPIGSRDSPVTLNMEGREGRLTQRVDNGHALPCK